ncbi:MAG: gliding motility protein, partial [Myxococcaceae bacterium]
MDENAAVASRTRSVEALVRWVLVPERGIDLFGATGIQDSRTSRLRFLLAVLEREPDFRARLQRTFATVLRDASLVRLLCSTGLPTEAGFFSELTSRVASSLLPEAPDARDLSRPLVRAFSKPEDLAWLAGLERPLVDELLERVFDDSAREQLSAQRRRALSIITTRVAALGLVEEFMSRADDVTAFLALSRSSESPDPADIARCRQTCEVVREHLEQYGVSTNLVFRLESIHQGLDRATALSRGPGGDGDGDAHPASRLLASVLTDAIRQRSVRNLVGASSRQLARKIVERSGSTGDHYITSTRRQWFGMLGSAGGGGVLTAGTAWAKYLVGWLSLPLFIEGALNSANYALSFLVMQLVGFTLATKQPSMTAAALARALERDGAAGEHAAAVELVARMVRSQLAAVLGNLGFVIPACLALDLLLASLRGHGIFDAWAGTYVVQSLHPLRSGTIFHAALTGILLWLSSVCAGWLDNWVAYRRLSRAIAHAPRLNAFFGTRLSGWLGRAVGRSASAFAGCVSLGVFLGMVPLASKLFGLPLDVRHVTLSTGGLTLAFKGLGLEGFVAAGGLWAILGIVTIGLLNFGVSFACALIVAVRAR